MSNEQPAPAEKWTLSNYVISSDKYPREMRLSMYGHGAVTELLSDANEAARLRAENNKLKGEIMSHNSGAYFDVTKLRKLSEQLAELQTTAIQLAGERDRAREALEEINREASGALNNAFLEEAPEILSHIRGIAARTLNPPANEAQRAQRADK